MFNYMLRVLTLSSFFFFGGLSIHLSQALLAHMFSYNITWGATKKEVERSNFWLEVPKILKPLVAEWTREGFIVSFKVSFVIKTRRPPGLIASV